MLHTQKRPVVCSMRLQTTSQISRPDLQHPYHTTSLQISLTTPKPLTTRLQTSPPTKGSSPQTHRPHHSPPDLTTNLQTSPPTSRLHHKPHYCPPDYTTCLQMQIQLRTKYSDYVDLSNWLSLPRMRNYAFRNVTGVMVYFVDKVNTIMARYSILF